MELPLFRMWSRRVRYRRPVWQGLSRPEKRRRRLGHTSIYEIGGGSFGLQLGIEATDVVIVFTNRDGIKPLLKGKLKIGADASATAGPVGRKAEAGTDILLKSAIYSYSRSKGLFAGIALDGAVIQLDDDANKSVYGKKTVASDISKGKVGATAIAVVQPFLRALQCEFSRTMDHLRP
jgi:lipid-binding SYLF domain-containing protein